MAEGWIDKARNNLSASRDHLKALHWSESIQASQECVELSVKAILLLLTIDFDRSHSWKREDEFQRIAKQVQEKGIVEKLASRYLSRPARLPRLLLLFRFWAEFYSTAKYGWTTEFLAPAGDLFEKQEAELAIAHADECLLAASDLRYLPEKDLESLESDSGRAAQQGDGADERRPV